MHAALFEREDVPTILEVVSLRIFMSNFLNHNGQSLTTETEPLSLEFKWSEKGLEIFLRLHKIAIPFLKIPDKWQQQYKKRSPLKKASSILVM